MDFITGLPTVVLRNREVDSILTIVDRYTKMTFLYAVSTSIDAATLANLFHNNIELTFGGARGIVSDRGSVFTSNFWSELCHYSKVKMRTSTAFHAQTDGQTERMNQTAETYLRCFVRENLECWPNLLRSAAYCMNNAVNATLGCSPNMALMGYNPDFRELVEDHSQLREVLAVQDRLEKLGQLRERLNEHWRNAVESHAKYYDKKHKPQTLQVRQLVGISTKNWKIKFKKLTPKFVGPFRILKKIGTQAYQVALPAKYARLHPVFSVQMLEPWKGNAMRVPHRIGFGTSPYA